MLFDRGQTRCVPLAPLIEVARFGSFGARQGIPASLPAAPDFVSKRSKICKYTAIETRPIAIANGLR
ncbi:hypothetical protein HZ326_28598 [Fusarium oxysporum f. sp. albedinis]|nr:hypothetical protein HZ326_28598 [Fusarium oxysporum f. sp. albedinis]